MPQQPHPTPPFSLPAAPLWDAVGLCGQGQTRFLYSRRWLVFLLMPINVGRGRGSLAAEHLWATPLPATCLLTQPLALPSPLALRPHGDDTGWFSAPFILKPLIEQFPYRSVGRIAAEVIGTSAIRVGLTSAMSSAGQPGLFSSPWRSQGPSAAAFPWQWCGKEGHTCSGSTHLQGTPACETRQGGWHRWLLAAAPTLGTPQQPCSSH